MTITVLQFLLMLAWLFILGLWLGYILWGPRPKPRGHIVSQWYDVPPTEITRVWVGGEIDGEAVSLVEIKPYLANPCAFNDTDEAPH